MNIDEIVGWVEESRPCDRGEQTLALIVEAVEWLACHEDEKALELFREAFSLTPSWAEQQKLKWGAYLSEKRARSAQSEVTA